MSNNREFVCLYLKHSLVCPKKHNHNVTTMEKNKTKYKLSKIPSPKTRKDMIAMKVNHEITATNLHIYFRGKNS